MKTSSYPGKQGGFSMLCLLSGLLVVFSAIYLGVKLGPSYFEYRVIANAVDEMIILEDIQTLPTAKIQSRMSESVRRNSGVNPTKLNIHKITYIGVRDGKRVVGIEYEVVKKMFLNVSTLIHYKYERIANTGSPG